MKRAVSILLSAALLLSAGACNRTENQSVQTDGAASAESAVSQAPSQTAETPSSAPASSRAESPSSVAESEPASDPAGPAESSVSEAGTAPEDSSVPEAPIAEAPETAWQPPAYMEAPETVVLGPVRPPQTVQELKALYSSDGEEGKVAVYVNDGTYPVESLVSMAGVMSGGKAPANTGLLDDAKVYPAPKDVLEKQKQAPQPEGTEEYTAIEENEFIAASRERLSTFAVESDTASYSNVRRMIAQGSQVPPDAVRIEELINYFRYDYPDPKAGEPFSVTTEIAPCPWNPDTQLLMVGLQAPKVSFESLKPSNLVYLIDVSGSMYSGDKLPLVKRAFRLLTENLREGDRISIVTYASGDAVVLEGAKGSDQFEIMSAIEKLNAEGSTYGSKGIETAYRIAQENFIEGGNNRVILATDGDLNVGLTTVDELTQLIGEKRESGIFLSVLGFGSGNLKDDRMEALAKNGNGNYYYIDTLLEAKRVLAEEMGGTLATVAKDVKFQLDFNPRKVKGYRLIGYENRLLDAADFMDDTKDAGEIGAGHRVTVLYEIADTDSKQKIPGAKQKDGQHPSFGLDNEWATVKIRYKEPDAQASQELDYTVTAAAVKSHMSDNMNFASAVAQVGMLLRRSQYAGSASYAKVLDQLGGAAQYEDSYKQEFCLLVELLNSK